MAKLKKIALEEHFLTPAMEEYWAPTVVDIDRAIYDWLHARLVDFGGPRLEAMDRAGFERSADEAAASSKLFRSASRSAERLLKATRRDCLVWRAGERNKSARRRAIR